MAAFNLGLFHVWLVQTITTAISFLFLSPVGAQSNQPEFAHRFIAQDKEIKTVHGAAYRATADGRIIWEEMSIFLPVTNLRE